MNKYSQISNKPQKPANNTLLVRQPEEPIPAEVIATAIVEIGAAMKKLSSTRLKRDAIVTLIAQRSKLGRSTIEIVLNNLENLEENWLKPKV